MPKQLMPVAGRPILLHCLDNIRAIGITEVGIVVGEHAEAIEAAVGDGSALGLDITYLRQEAPLGLAHRVLLARDFLGADDFVLYLGDNALVPGIAEAAADFRRRRPAAQLMPAKVADPRAYRVAELQSDGRIRALVEKPRQPRSDLAVIGVCSNVVGTQRLLDAAVRHGTERFLYVSTDEVYGSIRTGRWTEDSPLLPKSPYAASKAAGDLLARAYHRTYGLDVRITRCSNNYGTHQHPEKLIPRFVTRILAGQPVPLYGDGRNVRERLHVEDHCRALQLVLTRGRAGEVYNVGGGEALSNRDMTARLLNLLDARWDVVRHVEDRKGHDLRYAIDDTKIREQLGYAPRWSLDRGLPQVVA
jgi:nucleoside-diphosphate-sugar epimerase